MSYDVGPNGSVLPDHIWNLWPENDLSATSITGGPRRSSWWTLPDGYTKQTGPGLFSKFFHVIQNRKYKNSLNLEMLIIEKLSYRAFILRLVSGHSMDRSLGSTGLHAHSCRHHSTSVGDLRATACDVDVFPDTPTTGLSAVFPMKKWCPM